MTCYVSFKQIKKDGLVNVNLFCVVMIDSSDQFSRSLLQSYETCTQQHDDR